MNNTYEFYRQETIEQVAATVKAFTGPGLTQESREALEAAGVDFSGLADAIGQAAEQQPDPALQDHFRATARNLTALIAALEPAIATGDLATLLEDRPAPTPLPPEVVGDVA